MHVKITHQFVSLSETLHFKFWYNQFMTMQLLLEWNIKEFRSINDRASFLFLILFPCIIILSDHCTLHQTSSRQFIRHYVDSSHGQCLFNNIWCQKYALAHVGLYSLFKFRKICNNYELIWNLFTLCPVMQLNVIVLQKHC